MKEINLGNNLVELYDQPIQGRLFVVGDLHGCYTLLMNKLDELKFNFQHDLLVSVGDLVSLPLVIKNEKEVDLTWFDYAGEQLTHIFESRSVNEKWAETLINANGWMVFIRLNDETKYKHKIEDLLTNRDVIKKGKTKQEETDSVDANIWWIELFQIILHVCNLKRSKRISKPKLAIVLSCYDQISNSTSTTTPKEIFEKELPLLNQFLHSNWEQDRISIWGLSSLGRALDKRSQNTFVDNGPENQGWIISPDNPERSADLTSPIVWIYG